MQGHLLPPGHSPGFGNSGLLQPKTAMVFKYRAYSYERIANGWWIGTCNFQVHSVPGEIGAKTKKPSLRMFEHSDDFHRIFPLDFHYTQLDPLVG